MKTACAKCGSEGVTDRVQGVCPACLFGDVTEKNTTGKTFVKVETTWTCPDLKVNRGVLREEGTYASTDSAYREAWRYRVLKMADPMIIGDRKIECCMVEQIHTRNDSRSETTVWSTNDLPVGYAKRKTVVTGEEDVKTTVIHEVVDFEVKP